MILSSESLEIISYLKTAPGKFVSLPEISRRAGGRRRFQESPGWAKNLMSPLVDAKLIEVNARGHYRVAPNAQAHAQARQAAAAPRKSRAKIVGDDYFPSNDAPRIVQGDYFPAND